MYCDVGNMHHFSVHVW